ncbi:MAG: alpha-glucosidase [Clostridia bacterium]|nr:alpha-glucosidase [Clostridia bacterium]
MGKQIFTPDSKIRDLLQNPVGYDILAKLVTQTGKSMSLVRNPIVGNLRLRQLRFLAPKLIDDDLIAALLGLLNREPEQPPAEEEKPEKAWWKEAVVYQIYPRSFKDSNCDGIGDLPGITEKLGYLKALGVDVLWLSPVYDSPNDDNGYDIRDYRAILREFGTMEDFDALLEQAHARGMKLVMDLVVNHTSDEHPWFQAAQDESSPYHNYYIWKKSADPAKPPNNWISLFGGSAWSYYEKAGAWCLHLFTKKQMDLNWENEAVRAEVYDIMRWWLKKGIDGFRMDVISFISKAPGLPDGNRTIGGMMGFCGVEHYFYGPRLHEYLRELRRETFGRYDVLTVGEAPGVGMEISKLLTAQSRSELDMVFCFDHLENPGKARFDDYRYDLNFLKKGWSDWQLHYGNDCWNTLFLENHDNPRMISKVNPDPQYRQTLGKLLAVMQLTLKGTPFIFQGQELGMINADYQSISQLRDIESLNLYGELVPKIGEEAAFKKVVAGSRDNARAPMQWSGAANGGFSDVKPWIDATGDYPACNAESEEQDGNSLLRFYRALIALRHASPALVYGDFIPVKPDVRDVFCYFREYEGARFYVELNLSTQEKKRPLAVDGFRRIVSGYPDQSAMLRPYEAAVYAVD